MENLFQNTATIREFSWSNLGDIRDGRADLGEEMPVFLYRSMQFALLDVLTKELGADKADECFRKAGFLAGTEFAKQMLDLGLEMNKFLSHLSDALADYKIGILHMEAFDPDTGNLVLTVGQDLDCSGLPITNETACRYDEGFFSGIFNIYTGKEYIVREIDCWASGGRVCRFDAQAC